MRSTVSKRPELDGTGLLAQVREAMHSSPAAAITLCESAVARHPADAGPRRHLAVLLAASGQGASAIRTAHDACELAPGDARTWSDLGRVHALLGNLEDAAASFRRAIDADGRCADAWHNLGTALARLERPGEAFTAIKNALLIDPKRPETYLELGNLLVGSGQFEDALESFERATRLDPALAKARSMLAAFLSRRGKPARARLHFRESIGLDPGHASGWLGLGQVLEDLGDSGGALSCYRNVLAREPGHAAALGHYLALLRVEAPDGLVEACRARIDDARVPDEARALVAYGLAKYHDRRGEFGAAATAGSAANAARRRVAGPFDREAFRTRMDGLVRQYDAGFFAARRAFGMGTGQPVFIVGLPRSGTTLTERVIDAHPLLHGAGELQDLSRLAARAAGDAGLGALQAPAALDAARSRDAAQTYLRALRDGAPKGSLRISDKAPLNFMHLAFAALLFPNARVIYCRRDARDNALSIWMENFNAEQRYATDFGDLAFHAGQCARLMDHWRSALPLPVLEVRYEDTVADLESQARRIMAFLEVPWDRRCLDFHDSSRAVQTPSRWQVRQPIYTRSVGRWRNYAAALPGLDAVGPAEGAPA